MQAFRTIKFKHDLGTRWTKGLIPVEASEEDGARRICVWEHMCITIQRGKRVEGCLVMFSTTRGATAMNVAR